MFPAVLTEGVRGAERPRLPPATYNTHQDTNGQCSRCAFIPDHRGVRGLKQHVEHQQANGYQRTQTQTPEAPGLTLTGESLA